MKRAALPFAANKPFAFYTLGGRALRIDNSPVLRYNTIQLAAVAELADARDLKSLGGNIVPVRSRSAALAEPYRIFR